MRSLSGGLFYLWLFTLKKSQSVLHFQQLSTRRAAPLHLASGDSRYFIFSQKGKRNHERKIGQHYEKCALSD